MKDNINFDPMTLLPKIKGKYTVQLFDEEGNKIQEIEKHNCINKLWYIRAFYNTYIAGAMTGICRGYTNSWWYGADYDSNTDQDYATLYNCCYLTYDEQAPVDDDTSSVMWGTFLARTKVLKQENSNASYAGNLNVNESKISYEVDSRGKKISATRHIVMDYSTDRANGIFNNIYLTSDTAAVYEVFTNDSSYQENLPGHRHYVMGRLNTEPLSLKFNLDDDDIYNVEGTLSIDKKNKKAYYGVSRNSRKNNGSAWNTKDVVVIDLLTHDIKKIIKLDRPSDMDGMFTRLKCFAAGYIYTQISSDSGSNDTRVIKFDLKGKYLKTLDMRQLTGFNNIYGYSNACKVIGDEEYMYYRFWEKDTNPSVPTCHIATFDKDENLVRIQTLPRNIAPINEKNLDFLNSGNSSYSTYDVLITLGNKKWLSTFYAFSSYYPRNVIVPLEPNEDGVYDYNHVPTTRAFAGIDSYVSGAGGCNGAIIDEKGYFPGKMYNNSVATQMYVCNSVPWFSHMKLDTPVTKTAVNTMKIIYDITVDYVFPGEAIYLN